MLRISVATALLLAAGSVLPSAAVAATPSGVAFSTATTASLEFNWNLESPGQTPIYALSTVSNFSTTLSSQTGAPGQENVSFGSLSKNTTYYFKVKVSTESDAAYSAVIEDVDRRMLLIFALGVKHELLEAASEEPDIKLIEANRFWLPLRGWVEANVPEADFALMDAELLGELEGAPLIEALEAVAADPSVLDAAAVTAEIDKVIAALQ